MYSVDENKCLKQRKLTVSPQLCLSRFEIPSNIITMAYPRLRSELYFFAKKTNQARSQYNSCAEQSGSLVAGRSAYGTWTMNNACLLMGIHSPSLE